MFTNLVSLLSVVNPAVVRFFPRHKLYSTRMPKKHYNKTRYRIHGKSDIKHKTANHRPQFISVKHTYIFVR